MCVKSCEVPSQSSRRQSTPLESIRSVAKYGKRSRKINQAWDFLVTGTSLYIGRLADRCLLVNPRGRWVRCCVRIAQGSWASTSFTRRWWRLRIDWRYQASMYVHVILHVVWKIWNHIPFYYILLSYSITTSLSCSKKYQQDQSLSCFVVSQCSMEEIRKIGAKIGAARWWRCWRSGKASRRRRCKHLGEPSHQSPFPREYPQLGWFIMENPIKMMDELGVSPFQETSRSAPLLWVSNDHGRFSIGFTIIITVVHVARDFVLCFSRLPKRLGDEWKLLFGELHVRELSEFGIF